LDALWSRYLDHVFPRNTFPDCNFFIYKHGTFGEYRTERKEPEVELLMVPSSCLQVGIKIVKYVYENLFGILIV
jgi:hypothetical protein